MHNSKYFRTTKTQDKREGERRLEEKEEDKSKKEEKDSPAQTQRKDKWLRNIKESWRDVTCVCGSNFHFDGDTDKLFEWENIHLRHFASDSNNHSIISFYPLDMIIYYHSQSGYIIERRKHKSHEISEINQSLLMDKVTLIGA
ncbi:MAG: hypothetical protein M3162_06125 [Thermoproteota archaeon]|nr:hypothetical protein [Thermoproteota archaeon]